MNINKQCISFCSTLFDKILPSSSSKFSTTGRVRNQKGLWGIQKSGNLEMKFVCDSEMLPLNILEWTLEALMSSAINLT